MSSMSGGLDSSMSGVACELDTGGGSQRELMEWTSMAFRLSLGETLSSVCCPISSGKMGERRRSRLVMKLLVRVV